jgi:threonine aldolase
VICETNGHIYNYEMGALAALAGVLPRVVNGEDGVLTVGCHRAGDPAERVLPSSDVPHLPREHRQHGGRHGIPDGDVEEICGQAHERGIHVHLDGARVFNAATYLNEQVPAMTSKFDSVQFCLSKDWARRSDR